MSLQLTTKIYIQYIIILSNAWRISDAHSQQVLVSTSYIWLFMQLYSLL